MKHSFRRASAALVCGKPGDGVYGTAVNLIASCAMLIFAGCDDGCDNEMLLQSRSPSGAHDAVVFRRSCGATTGYSTHVSVLPPSRTAVAGGGNVLVLDGDHQLALKWSGDRMLRIIGPNQVQVFRREGTIDDLRITYEGLKHAEAPK